MHCDDETALLLASLALQAEYGDYQPEVALVLSSESRFVVVVLFLFYICFSLLSFVVRESTRECWTNISHRVTSTAFLLFFLFLTKSWLVS